MGKKRIAGRSFFSNLPLDMRSNLRSQLLVPLIPGLNIQDQETKREAIGEGSDLLPTQPASIGSDSDSNSSNDEDDAQNEGETANAGVGLMNGMRNAKEPILQERKEVVAESSMDALRRRALEMEQEKARDTAKPKASVGINTPSQPSSKKRPLEQSHEISTGVVSDLPIVSTDTNSFSASMTKKQRRNAKGKGRGRPSGAGESGSGLGGHDQEKLGMNRFKGHRWDCTGLVKRYTKPTEMPSELVKYFYQRLFLLPQYDVLPLLLDDTGWFSITPQPIAAHIAERCTSDVIIDAFCGVGGNTIEFAKTCERVIAIDNDPVRLRLARHNALQLGVADRIEFIFGDFVSYAKSLLARGIGEEIDVVFLSPPWGGTEYLSFGDPSAPNQSSYPLSAILPVHGKELFELCTSLTPNIAYYLPRNVNVDELSALARPLDAQEKEGGGGRDREWVEIEEAWVGDKLKAVTAYYGALIAEAE